MSLFQHVKLRMPDGTEYGPVTSQEMTTWYEDNRVPPDAYIIDADTGESHPATVFFNFPSHVPIAYPPSNATNRYPHQYHSVSPVQPINAARYPQYQQPAALRPKPVTVIAIFFFVSALFALFGFIAQQDGETNRMLHTMMGSKYIAVNSIFTFLSMLTSIGIGIALLKMFNWARLLTIYSTIILFIYALINALIVSSKLQHYVDRLIYSGNTPEFPSESYSSLWGGFLFSAIIYGVIIYYLRRADIVAAFEYDA